MPSATRLANLQRLLRPRHLAFVGGRDLDYAVRRSRTDGFEGPIWVVNPKYSEIAGQRCFPSIADLPDAPDASYVAVRRELTLEAVAALAARGAGGAICYASGFAETGPAGAELQRRLVEAARDLALIGPNCYGMINYLDGVTLWPTDHGGERLAHGVAVVTQSGNMGFNLTMAQRSVPLAYVVSVGNQAALHAEDLIDGFLADSRVQAIGLHIEGIQDPAAFSRAALKALEKNVPVVVLKTGTSELGARLALSHTASLAGSDDCFEAMCVRYGLLRAHSAVGFMEALKLVAVTGIPRGRRIAVMTCSGGDAEIAADAADAAGLVLSPPTAGQIAELKSLLPDFATLGNPLDFTTKLWGDRVGLTRCLSVLAAEGADLAMAVVDYPRLDIPDGNHAGHDATCDAVIAAGTRSGLPAAVASVFPESLPEPARRRLIAAGVAPLQGIEDACAAIAAAASFGDRRRRFLESGGTMPPPLDPAGQAPASPRLLDEAESKRRLAAHGLVVPKGRVVAPVDAAAAAAEIGFPVALKLVSAALPHKTEAGAVLLGLDSPQAVDAAVADLPERMRRRGVELPVETVLVEEMVTDAVVELIVGVTRDPVFGLVLVVGSGGVLVELVADSRTLLLPTDAETVAAAIASLRVGRLLAGYRGRPAGDLVAAVAAVLAVAGYVAGHRETLVELDINPLLIRPANRGAVAADALIRLG